METVGALIRNDGVYWDSGVGIYSHGAFIL